MKSSRAFGRLVGLGLMESRNVEGNWQRASSAKGIKRAGVEREWYPSFVEQNSLLCLYWLHIGESKARDLSDSSGESQGFGLRAQPWLACYLYPESSPPASDIMHRGHHQEAQAPNTKITSLFISERFRNFKSLIPRRLSHRGMFQRKRENGFPFPRYLNCRGKPKTTTGLFRPAGVI